MQPAEGPRHIVVPSWSTTRGAAAPTSLLAVAPLAAIASAQGIVDGDAVRHAPDGDLSTSDVEARTMVSGSLLAHYVTTYFRSTACALMEELARPLRELTAPNRVSWSDRFVLAAGHPPHPLGHCREASSPQP